MSRNTKKKLFITLFIHHNPPLPLRHLQKSTLNTMTTKQREIFMFTIITLTILPLLYTILFGGR